MRMSVMAASSVLLLAGSLAGCVLRGPSGLKNQVAEANGRTYKREFGFTLGRTSMALARWGVGMSGEQETRRMLQGIHKVQVGVYEVVEAGDGSRGPLASDFHDWDPLVRMREDDESVLVLARGEADRFHRLLMVVDSEDELVLVRLRGDLNDILEEAIRMSLEEIDREDLEEPVLEEYRKEKEAAPGESS